MTSPEVVRAGRPLNNLAQEMSQRDERFRKDLANVLKVGIKNTVRWPDSVRASKKRTGWGRE